MNTHRVVRAFPGGRPYKIGDEVDASQWRNARKLVETRYLEPLLIQQVPAQRPSDQGSSSDRPPANDPKAGQQQGQQRGQKR